MGDIESLPFLEAVRQMSLKMGPTNCAFLHLTLVPWIAAAGELKTKPTQHSVQKLREIGIMPDALLCRADRPIPDEERAKISLFANVPEFGVISVWDADTVYKVPRMPALVLAAPMLGLAGRVPGAAMHQVARVMAGWGDDRRPAWKWKETPGDKLAWRARMLTHDANRYADEMWWRESRPELAMGPGSWRWVERAYASMRGLERPGVLEQVTIPVGANRSMNASSAAASWSRPMYSPPRGLRKPWSAR